MQNANLLCRTHGQKLHGSACGGKHGGIRALALAYLMLDIAASAKEKLRE